MADTKSTATQVGRDAADKVRETVATNELAQKAKDAAYTIVGLGVMGAQKATATTKQAAKQLRGEDASVTIDVDGLKVRSKDATDSARRQFAKVDEILVGAIARLEDALSPLEEKLPGSARETVQRAKVVGKGLHAQMRVKVAGELEAPATKPGGKSKATQADAA
jgi:hypothetical protein